MLELGQIIRSFISLLIFHFMAPSVLAKCQLKCYLNTHCHKLWFTHSLMCNVAFFNTPLRDKSTCSLCTTASHCESGIWGRLGDWRIAENSCKCKSLNQLRYHLYLWYCGALSNWEFFIKMRAAFLLSPSCITQGRMVVRKAALILMKHSHFDRTPQYVKEN